MILIGRGLDFRYDLEPIGGSIRALARRMLPLLQLSNARSESERGFGNSDRRKQTNGHESWSCAVVSVRKDTEPFPVVMTKGSHLFPYRTQKLSPSVPMVLGW